MQEFGDKSEDLTGVFNSYWVFGDKKVTILLVLYIRTQIHKDTKILYLRVFVFKILPAE